MSQWARIKFIVAQVTVITLEYGKSGQISVLTRSQRWVCNIIPDSLNQRGLSDTTFSTLTKNHRKQSTGSSSYNPSSQYQSQQQQQQQYQLTLLQKPSILSNYLSTNIEGPATSRVSMPLSNRAKDLQQNLQLESSKETFRKSFHGYFSQRDHVMPGSNKSETKLSDKSKSKLFFTKTKDSSDEHEVVVDLRKHLDIFLQSSQAKQEEDLQPQQQKNQKLSKNEIFASFAHTANLLNDKQNVVQHITQLTKEKVFQLKQQITNNNNGSTVNSIQSQTPKFSFQLENGLMIEILNRSEQKKNKRTSFCNMQEKKIHQDSVNQQYYQSIPNMKNSARKSNRSKQSQSSDQIQKSSYFKNTQLANIESEEFSLFPLKQKFNDKKRKNKFKIDKNEDKLHQVHYSARIQKSSPCFKTMQQNQEEYFINDNENEFYLNTMADPRSPFSADDNVNSCSSKQKQNILYRTASLDHYLSNGRTFLKGQRFTSPTSSSQFNTNPLSDKNFEANPSKQSIQTYFVNLVSKKIQAHQYRQTYETFKKIASTESSRLEFIQQKFSILNLIKEFLQKQQAFKMWQKAIFNMTFKRKGFAVENMFQKLSQILYSNAFQRLEKFNFHKEDSECSYWQEQLITEHRERQIVKNAYDQWQQKCQFRWLSKRRDVIFGRAMVSILIKSQLKCALNKINLNLKKVIEKEQKKEISLNLKIKEFLIKMALSKENSHRYSKEKILRIMGIQQLVNTVDAQKKKNAYFFFGELKRIHEASKYTSQILQIQQNHNIEKENLQRQIKFQKNLIHKNAGLILSDKLIKMLKREKKQSFDDIKLVAKIKKSCSTMIKNYESSFNRTQQKAYFTKWQNFCTQSQSQDQRMLLIQKGVMEKWLNLRTRQRFHHWRKYAFQATEINKLQSSLLERIIERQNDSKKTIKTMFFKWVKQTRQCRQLVKFAQLFARNRLTMGFDKLKSNSSHQLLIRKLKLAALIVGKAINFDGQLKSKGFQSLKKYLQLHFQSQRQSQSALATNSIIRILSKIQHENLQNVFSTIKQQSRTKKNKDQYYRQTLENFVETVADIKRQRYYQTFSLFKQISILKYHQQQVLLKLCMKQRFKQQHLYFKQWEKISHVILSQKLFSDMKQTQKHKALKQIFANQFRKTTTFTFNEWRTISTKASTEQKIETTIRTMAAASKIFDLFNQHSRYRKYFSHWQKVCQSFEQFQLGLQMLNNIQKKKVKMTFRLIKQHSKRQRNTKKQNKVKARAMLELLDRIYQKKWGLVMRQLISFSLVSKFEYEKKKLKQQKSEIHNQIVLLTEKDTKIRKQEAYLTMKEQRIVDQEKEIKDKQKRLVEISKSVKERTTGGSSKSPSDQKTPKSQMNKQPSMTKFNSIKNHMDQYMSVGSSQISNSKLLSSTQSMKMVETKSKKSDSSMPFQKPTIDLRKVTNAHQAQSFLHIQQNSMTGKENSKGSCKNSVQEIKKSSYISQSTNQNIHSSITSLNSLRSNEVQSCKNSNNNNMEKMHAKLLKVAAQQMVDKLNKIYLAKRLQSSFVLIRQSMVNDRQREGAQILSDWASRKLLSQSLIQWLKSVYFEEIMMQESIEAIRERKLLRAVMIVERSQTKDEVLLLKAFKEWKRIEYQMVLEGLKKYSATLERNVVSASYNGKIYHARMEEAKRLLYEKAIRKFTFQEVAKHKTISNKNLIEMLSRYPNYGTGFKVYRKWWPENMFYHVKKVHLFSPRYGTLWGIKYKDGVIAGNKIETIDGVLKRGMWNYRLDDPAFTDHKITLDNGASFDLLHTSQLIAEKKAFLAERNKVMEVLKAPPVVKKEVKKAAAKTPAKPVIVAKKK